MNKLTTKDITRVALLSAVVAVSSYLLLMQFVFIVIVRSVTRVQAYLIAICSSLLTYIFWGFAGNTLLNFIVMPLIAFLIYQFEDYIEGREKNLSHQQIRINLSIVSFIIIIIANYTNSIVYGLVVLNNPFAYLLFNTPSNIGFGLLNSVLIYFLAEPVKTVLDQLIAKTERHI